jgi:hypothetical protein
MANQIVDFYRQENPGTGLTDDGITLHYAEQYADQLPQLLKDYPDFGRDYNRIYDEAFPLTAGERAKQALGSFVKGVAGTVASIPEAVGIARTEAFGRGLGVGTTDYRETLMGQLAEGIRSVGDMASPEVAEAKAEKMADSFWNTKVFSAVGSGVGFLGTGGVTGLGVRSAAGGIIATGAKKAAGEAAKKSAKTITGLHAPAVKAISEKAGKKAGERYLKKKAAQINTGSIAVLGSLANATAGYKDALANGGSPDQALSSYLLNGLVGTSEAIPLGRMLNRLDDASGGTFMYYLANAAPEALEEALQEAAQSVAGDIIAANIVKYDPDREMFKDLEEDAAAGGISGAVLSLIMSALTRKTKALTDAKVGKFVEEEGVVEGTGEETVEDAKARYTVGDEEGIKQLAIRVASQLEADPSGNDNEAWGELKKIQGELIGSDPDARMIFDAEFFKANQRRAADRAEKVINTKFGEVSNPEKRASREVEDTQLVSPEELVGTEYEPSLDIAGEEDVDIFGNVKTAQRDKIDPDAEANFAEFKAQLLEQRNALVGELMDVKNSINLARAGVEETSVTPEQRAAYEQMLVGKQEELAGRIQAINKEIAGIEQRVREVGRFQPEISLVEEPVAARGLEDRVEEAEQDLNIEQRLVARQRETRQGLERLEKEELDTAEKQQYWDELAQDLADDRELLGLHQEQIQARLEADLATLESMDTGEFSDEDKLAHFELTQEIRQKLQGGVTTEQAAADLGLSRDQLSRLVRFTEGQPQGFTPVAPLVNRRFEGGRTVGPLAERTTGSLDFSTTTPAPAQGTWGRFAGDKPTVRDRTTGGPVQIRETLERRKARLEKTIKDKFRKGWSFKAEKFTSKPIPKSEKEAAKAELKRINADLARIKEAETVTKPPSAGKVLAQIKAYENMHLKPLRAKLAAAKTKEEKDELLRRIEAIESKLAPLKASYEKLRSAQVSASSFNNLENAQKSVAAGAIKDKERRQKQSNASQKQVERLGNRLDSADELERTRIQKLGAGSKLLNKLKKGRSDAEILLITKQENLEKAKSKNHRNKLEDKIEELKDTIADINRKIEKIEVMESLGASSKEADELIAGLDEGEETGLATGEGAAYDRILNRHIAVNKKLDSANKTADQAMSSDPLAPQNIDIEGSKQDRTLQETGPAYYEIGTKDSTTGTRFSKEANIKLQEFAEATDEETKIRLSHELGALLHRGASDSGTSAVTRRLVSFVGPDGKIWVLGLGRGGDKKKTQWMLVPPGTSVDEKEGYSGIRLYDLMQQGYIPFASIRLTNSVHKFNYSFDTMELYNGQVETFKSDVKKSNAFTGQVTQGAVTGTVSLDAITEKIEPVFGGGAEVSRSGATAEDKGLAAARKSAIGVVDESTEEAPVTATPASAVVEATAVEEVEDLTIGVLTEEGAGKVFDILDKARAKVEARTGEVVVDEDTGLTVSGGASAEFVDEVIETAVEESIEEIIESDQDLQELAEALGISEDAALLEGRLQEIIINEYKQNSGSREGFIRGVISSEGLQEIADQIRKAAAAKAENEKSAIHRIDELVAKRQEEESDPNSREDTVSEREVPQRAEVNDEGVVVFPRGLDKTGARPIEGTHKSSNLGSLEGGFEQRELGISIARVPEEQLTSPTRGETKGTKGVVEVTVSGNGLDYGNAKDRKLIEGLENEASRKDGPIDVYVIKRLRELGYSWVNGWNGIGESAELHVIDASAIEITDTAVEQAATLNIEFNIDGAPVRLTNEQAEDPAFRKKNRLAPLVYMVDEKTKKKIPVLASSEDKVRLRGYAPDRPDNAYPRVSQRKLNKIFNYLIERMRALGVQVEITDKEFVNASTKAKAMFGFANGKPVIVLAMNSLENPTTQNLFDLLHEIGHAATADLPQEARLRVLAAISKLNDAVLRIPGRKFKYSIDEAESLEEVEQEERLVEAIASALMSENFDPTTANTLSRKIVKFFRDLMMAVKQAFHRMMGHEGQVAMNYFKVQVEAMLTGNHAPAYLSWVSGYKYSISDRMSSMDLVESDSIIDSTHDLSTFSKEYKLVVSDSPEAVEHNIRWAGIRFTADRPELTDVDRAVARMEAQRTIAANNALNDILDDLYNTVKRVGGSRFSYLSKEEFVKKLTKNRIPDERIKKALEVSQDPSLANTQMQDLEAEEARKSAGVELDRYLRSIQTSLENLSKEALKELNVNNLDSTQVAHDQLKAKNIALAAKYEDLSFVQGLIAGVSDELVKKRNERADGKIDVVLKELGVKATEAEIEAALKSLREKKLVDSIELLSTEITEWGKGEAKVIQKRIEALGDPRLDVFKDPATLALTISTARHQPALMGLLAVRRAGEMEGMKQVLNKAIRDAASGNTEGLLDGWDSVVGGKSRTAMFERLTTKARKALAAVIQTEEARRNAHLTLEKYEDDVLLDEKLGDPLNRYIEEVGTVFGKENILPEWLVNADGSRPKEWVASHGAMYVVPPNPKASITDLKNKANHKKLNLREISHIGQMVQDIEKMNAWLLEQPVESRGGEYNMVKRMVDRMTEVQAIQYHRELGNSFVVRLMGSLTDKLEMVGTPAAVKIAAQLKRFAYYIASYAGSGTKSAVYNGKIWSEKMTVAMNKVNGAGGNVDLKSFKQKFYGPAMQYFHHRRDILNDARDRESGENKLINSWLNYLAANDSDMKPIVRAASAELKAFYKQTAVNSRQIAEVSSKMGVLVYDEKGEYFRERIGSSISTTMRQTNSIAKGVYDFISPIWGRNIANKETLMAMSEEEFANYVQARFDNQRTIDEFATPIVERPGSSVFRYPDGGALNRDVVTDSLKKHPKDMVGFINELTERAGVEAEEVKEFQVGIIQRFQSFYTKLNDVVEQQETTKGFLGGKRAVPIHVMMDARKFNDFPLEWVDYAEFTERRMYQYVKNLAAESAFGRDMVQVDNDFAMAQNDIESASSLHDQIEKDINRLGFLSRLNPWARRNYNKKYDERAAELQQGRAKTYSGKMLRQSTQTQRLLNGIQESFRSYMAKERDSALEFTVWNELIRAMTGLVVQSPGTALVDTIAIVEQPWRKMGINRYGFKMMLNNITGSFGIGAGSFFQVFNKTIKFAHDDMAKMMELGLDDGTAHLEGGWFKRLRTEFRANMADEMVSKNMLTRGVEKTSRGIRSLLETGIGRAEEGQGAFPVFRPQAIFSQIAKQSSMANTIATWKMFRNFIANAADYIEAHPEAMELYKSKGMIFNENALGKSGLDKALAEMGYGKSFLFFNNSKAYHHMYNTLVEGGFNLEKVALDYIERRKSDSKADPLDAGYAPDNSLLMALAHTTQSQVMLETDVTTRAPGFLTNPIMYASMPLLGWSVQKFVDINKSMMNDRNAYGSFLGTVEGMKAYLAILPVGMVYAFLRDEYDEEVLGKKSSLQSGKGLFFKGDGMPSIEEFQTDPHNAVQVAVERFDRVGIFGFGGEMANNIINDESARELSVDSRVYALNTLRNARRVLTALALQRPQNATYASIYRPVIQNLGGNGFLQYAQILNNALAKTGSEPLFEQEYAMAQRIGTNNFLRAAGRYLNLDVRTFSGTRGITTTRMRPWVSDMLMASITDDQVWFDTSWRRAVQEAEAMGKTDPEDSVKRSYQAYHPLRYIYQTMPTELEYLQILDSIEETSGIEGRMQVQQTIRNINDYGSLMGITPSEGKAERSPSPSTMKRQVFGDDFRKPTKQQILQSISGF